MRRLICGIFLSICLNISFAAELLYPVSAIPEALKANAHTVYREQKCELTINSENSATAKIIEARTILNKNGENNVKFIESYNPMNKITSIKATVYDQNGKKVHTRTLEDAIDRSAIGFSLYADNRVYILDPNYLTYPFTVKYEYEINYKQTLFLPGVFLPDYNTSYEDIDFSVTTPLGFELKYNENKLPSTCVKTNSGNKIIYNWKMKAIPARLYEPFTQHFKPNYPQLQIVPLNFKVDDSHGSTVNWKSFGDWAYSLNSVRGNLPAATVEKMKQLTANLKTDREKVKAVYEYMQKKTRYVSVQIGIGGWQPFGADVVDKNAYGDCKALSNYMYNLLNAIGIKSHYVLVTAGENAREINPDFVASQFNHAIVCVPLKGDTIWLENTSQINPFGYTGTFTDDRLVLLVDSGNSKLVRTRVYSANENCINRHATVELTAENTAIASVTTNYIGLAYDDMQPILHADDNEKKKKITENINIPGFALSNFTLTEKSAYTPEICEKLNLELTNCVKSLQGNIELLPLNLMNKLTDLPDKVRNRKTDMCIRRAYMENDTIDYKLPSGYTISDLPQNIKSESDFGEYTATITVNKNEIRYIRHFQLKKGSFSAGDYSRFREFLESISTADEVMIGIKKP
jgi:transglutaminase-like putative cysteine protease